MIEMGSQEYWRYLWGYNEHLPARWHDFGAFEIAMGIKDDSAVDRMGHRFNLIIIIIFAEVGSSFKDLTG